jgi:hypothetical protein
MRGKRQASSLVWFHSYTVAAAYCAAMPGVAGVADSGRGADVDPRRLTSSLARPAAPENLPFSLNHYLHMLVRPI